jgi:precorrin-2 dehydrogenase/sirohydrochlorin ferrochelatase
MDLYPLHLNLRNRLCLLVGGGRVAARKAAGLRAAGADITLVSPEATPALQKMAKKGEIEWRRERYGTAHLDGVFLVLACTDNRAVNAAVTREASARNLLALCADDPGAGSFVSPATVRRGDLLLTVSTGGAGPTLAAVVRERLEAEFGPEWAALTALIGAMREIVKTNPDEAGRRAAVKRVLDDAEVHELLAAGKRLEAETRIRQCLSSSSE